MRTSVDRDLHFAVDVVHLTVNCLCSAASGSNGMLQTQLLSSQPTLLPTRTKEVVVKRSSTMAETGGAVS